MRTSSASGPGPGGPASWTRLGRYEILKRLAVGGMAEIFVARARGLEGFEKIVVLKRIHPSLASNPEFVEMFLDEARIAATLQHPNVVQVYDIENIDGGYLFSMEYLHGADLHQIGLKLRQRQLGWPLEVAMGVMLGVTSGLNYAHEKLDEHGRPLGIVHRDVSPQNVIVTYDGVVKLVDFGIAKARGRFNETKGGALKGKVQYMSPEQCRSGPIDHRSDVFSAGIMLWELTTGAKLFDRESEFASMRAVVDADVPSPRSVRPEYPRPLEAVVMRALAKDPDRRWSSASELHDALGEIVRSERLAAGPATLSKFLRNLMGPEAEAWSVAQRSGKSLGQHLTEQLTTADLRGIGLDLPTEDEETGIRRRIGAIPVRPEMLKPNTIELEPELLSGLLLEAEATIPRDLVPEPQATTLPRVVHDDGDPLETGELITSVVTIYPQKDGGGSPGVAGRGGEAPLNDDEATELAVPRPTPPRVPQPPPLPAMTPAPPVASVPTPTPSPDAPSMAAGAIETPASVTPPPPASLGHVRGSRPPGPMPDAVRELVASAPAGLALPRATPSRTPRAAGAQAAQAAIAPRATPPRDFDDVDELLATARDAVPDSPGSAGELTLLDGGTGTTSVSIWRWPVRIAIALGAMGAGVVVMWAIGIKERRAAEAPVARPSMAAPAPTPSPTPLPAPAPFERIDPTAPGTAALAATPDAAPLAPVDAAVAIAATVDAAGAPVVSDEEARRRRRRARAAAEAEEEEEEDDDDETEDDEEEEEETAPAAAPKATAPIAAPPPPTPVVPKDPGKEKDEDLDTLLP